MINSCDLRRKICPLGGKRVSFLVSIACLYATLTLVRANQTIPEQPAGTTSRPIQVESDQSTTSAEILLSGDEFVDYTEAPTILFDSLANSNGSTTENVTTNPVSSQDSSQSGNSSEPTSIEEATTVMDEPEDSSNASEENTSEPGSTDSHLSPFEAPQNVSQYMDYIERLFHDLRHQITDLFEPHLPQLIRSSQMVKLSGTCSYDMLRMALALRQFEPWALRMIDSSGKLPEGIFEGSFTALGSYDECINTIFASQTHQQPAQADQSGPMVSSQPAPTQGKYCLVNVSPYLPPKPPADRVERMFQDEANRRNYSSENQFSRLSPMFYYMKFRIGVCLPSSCQESDMDSISSALSSSLRLNFTIPHCRIKESQPLTSGQLIGGIVFGLVLLLVVGATMMDYSSSKLRKQQALVMQSLTSHTCFEKRSTQVRRPKSWLASFSLLANFKLYFKEKPNQAAIDTCRQDRTGSSNIIRCLNGIRVLSLCWVIVANSYITLDPRATKRLTKTREAPRDFLFQVVVQASLAIETFFFLSGLLMSLSFARLLLPRSIDGSDKKETVSWLKWLQLYLHRYIRMTPPAMLVIAFTMFAFRYGDGPLWFEATNKAHESCSRNWWRHMAHVANFIDTRQMCFIHYWYIAADMQLFLLAPPLLYLLYRRPKLGYLLASLVGLSSIVWVFYTTYIRNLPPTLLFYNSDPESRREFGNSVMTKPLTHALPYIVGMLLGKWLSGCGDRKRNTSTPSKLEMIIGDGFEAPKSSRFPSKTNVLGILAILVALAEVFVPYKWNNSHLPTRFLGALYASLFRLAWSLVLAYLVVSCRHPKDARCLKQRARSLARSRSLTRVRGSEVHLTPAGLEQDRGELCLSCKAEAAHEWPLTSAGIQLAPTRSPAVAMCLCSRGGSPLNRFLALKVFAHLSRLSFVAYLIHLPLMSVFVAQTRGLFAFSHTLVIHLALSYLFMTFMLSFLLVHIIEFPFITFERYLFAKLTARLSLNFAKDSGSASGQKEESSRAVSLNSITSLDTKQYVMGDFIKPATVSDKNSTFEVSIRL